MVSMPVLGMLLMSVMSMGFMPVVAILCSGGSLAVLRSGGSLRSGWQSLHYCPCNGGSSYNGGDLRIVQALSWRLLVGRHLTLS